jgi:hypothetical protein
MSLTQRLTAYLAMVMFGVPSVFVALVGTELWPFLDYRMYAEAKRSLEVDWLAVVGETETGAAFALDQEIYIEPFAPSELSSALYTLDVFGEVDPSPARRALRGLLVAYERRRLAGEHNGPRLRSLAVYRVRWTARPGAANYAAPHSRTLLLRVSLPGVSP